MAKARLEDGTEVDVINHYDFAVLPRKVLRLHHMAESYHLMAAEC
jgi:hypothetical protein